jgi:hypothetical protein
MAIGKCHTTCKRTLIDQIFAWITAVDWSIKLLLLLILCQAVVVDDDLLGHWVPFPQLVLTIRRGPVVKDPQL